MWISAIHNNIHRCRRFGRSLLVSCAFLTSIKIHRLLDHLLTCSHYTAYWGYSLSPPPIFPCSCCRCLVLTRLLLLHTLFAAHHRATDIHPLNAMQCDLSDWGFGGVREESMRALHMFYYWSLVVGSSSTGGAACVGLCLYLGNMERRLRRLRGIASRFPSGELRQSKT